jgi:hypothetical protein
MSRIAFIHSLNYKFTNPGVTTPYLSYWFIIYYIYNLYPTAFCGSLPGGTRVLQALYLDIAGPQSVLKSREALPRRGM